MRVFGHTLFLCAMSMLIQTCVKSEYFFFTITPHASDDRANSAAFYGGNISVMAENGSSNTYALDILVLGGQGLGYEYDSRGAMYIRIPEGSAYLFSISSEMLPRKGPLNITLNLANSFVVSGLSEDTTSSMFPTSPDVPVSAAAQIKDNSNIAYPFISSGPDKIRDFRNLRSYSFSMW